MVAGGDIGYLAVKCQTRLNSGEVKVGIPAVQGLEGRNREMKQRGRTGQAG